MSKITLVREHPALFLGELHTDLERVYAEDENGKRYDIKVINNEAEDVFDREQIVHEILTAYPHNLQFEIVEDI